MDKPEDDVSHSQEEGPRAFNWIKFNGLSKSNVGSNSIVVENEFEKLGVTFRKIAKMNGEDYAYSFYDKTKRQNLVFLSTNTAGELFQWTKSKKVRLEYSTSTCSIFVQTFYSHLAFEISVDIFGTIRSFAFLARHMAIRTFNDMFYGKVGQEFRVNLGSSQDILDSNEPIFSAFPVVFPVVWKILAFIQVELSIPTQIALKENNSFRNVGLVLFGHKAFSQILTAIERVYQDMISNRNKPNPPFIFVALPSLAGKTELAVSLDMFALYRVWNSCVIPNPPFSFVLSFTASITRDNMLQAIYDSMNTSEELFKCAKEDLDNLIEYAGKQRTKIQSGFRPLNRSDIVLGSTLRGFSGIKSVFLGFFVELLKRIKGGQDLLKTQTIPFNPLSMDDARRILESLKSQGKPIVTFLDEFSTQDQSESCCISYLMRNYLREVGVIVIVAGTDTNAWNLLSTTEMHGRHGPVTVPWVYLVRVLPPAFKDSILAADEEFANAETFLKGANIEGMDRLLNWFFKSEGQDGILLSSKPGFHVFLLKELLKVVKEGDKKTIVEVLDSALNSSLYQVISRKELFERTLGKYGQLFVLFPAYRHDPLRIHEMRKQLVHEHFASLKLCENTSGRKDITGDLIPFYRTSPPVKPDPNERTTLTFDALGEIPLKIYSKFPAYHNDELFYLTLTSVGRHVRAIPSSTISFVEDLSEISRTPAFHLKDTPPPRSGDKLECIGVAAVAMSTHYSLSGVTLGKFLNAIVLEMLPVQSNLSKSPLAFTLFDFKNRAQTFTRSDWEGLLKIPGNVKEKFSDSRIPYIPPSGAKASLELRMIPGLITATLFQPKNSEEVDAVVIPDQVIILRECLDKFKLGSWKGPEEENSDESNSELYKKAVGKLKEEGYFIAKEVLLSLIIEMKDYEMNVDACRVLSVARKFTNRAFKDISKGFANDWVGLFFVSSLAKPQQKSLKVISDAFPNLEIYTIRRDTENCNDFVMLNYLEDIESDGELEDPNDQALEGDLKRSKKSPELPCLVPFHMFIIEVENLYGGPI